MKCKTCGEKLTGRQTKFCSKKCKGLDSNNQYQSYKKQRERAKARKLYLIEMLGGKCIKCGYDRNISVLCFHHKNPKLKSMSLTSREISNNRFELLEKEANKCELMCANCHTELHHPQLFRDKIKIKPDTFAKRKEATKRLCKKCENEISSASSGYCLRCKTRTCWKSSLTLEVLKKELKTKSKLQISKDHHISSHTINQMLS